MSGRSEEAALSSEHPLPPWMVRSSRRGDENSRMTRTAETAAVAFRFWVLAREGLTTWAKVSALRTRLTNGRSGERAAYISSNEAPSSAKENAHVTADSNVSCARALARSCTSAQALASTSGSAMSLRREAPLMSLLREVVVVDKRGEKRKQTDE